MFAVRDNKTKPNQLSGYQLPTIVFKTELFSYQFVSSQTKNSQVLFKHIYPLYKHGLPCLLLPALHLYSFPASIKQPGRKAKTKQLISQAVSFISDMAILASGLNESADVKKLFADVFMDSRLLGLHLWSCLKVFLYKGLRVVKYKALLFYTLFIPAIAAFRGRFKPVKIPALFTAMAGTLLPKKE